jgi:hypothetical protein
VRFLPPPPTLHQGGGNNYAPQDPYEKAGFRGMGVTKPFKKYGFVTPMPRNHIFS